MVHNFTIPSTARILLLAMIVLGVVCMGITFMTDDAVHSRFWSNFLHNSIFFTGIAIMSLFGLAAFTTAYAGWFTIWKRLWESYAQFIIVGLVLMGIIAIGNFTHMHHLYHWTDPNVLNPDSEAYDKILDHKSSFLNPIWYAVATFGFLGLFYFLARKLRSLSLAEDHSGILDFSHYKKIKVYAALVLPFVGFLVPAAIWQWLMSVDAHWYSTLFAWYCMASLFVTVLAITILMLIWLKSLGYFPNVSGEHFHDLGKYMFAISIFWTYLWFSQYMLIWYANVGEETVYFYERLKNYKALFFINLVVNFLLPFFVLMRNDTKRKYGSLSLVAIVLVFNHWLDFFLMVKPGVAHTTHDALAHMSEAAMDHGHHAHGMLPGFGAPGFLEIGTFLGFLGLFLYFVLWTLSNAPLVGRRDPYIGESLHHHV